MLAWAPAWALPFVLAISIASAPATAQTGGAVVYEGNVLYNVSMLRAAPGHYAAFMAALEESFALHEEAGDEPPLWIRHSQGDQWDFMVIYPMGDLPTYFEGARARRRASVWQSDRGRELARRLAGLTSYNEDWYARSAPVAEMRRRFNGMGLFHVEMFAGLAGTRPQLLEQRRMENRYYEHLDRQQNVLFIRESGSNWDAMTIGFYENLQAYAAAGVRYTAAQQDDAARAAGFDGVGNISPLLRSLLSYHHDTLGVRAR